MIVDFAVCKYCHKELNLSEYPERSHSLGRVWNFECSNDLCESRFIPPRSMTSKKGRFFQIDHAFVLALHSVGWGYSGALKVTSIINFCGIGIVCCCSQYMILFQYIYIES